MRTSWPALTGWRRYCQTFLDGLAKLLDSSEPLGKLRHRHVVVRLQPVRPVLLQHTRPHRVMKQLPITWSAVQRSGQASNEAELSPVPAVGRQRRGNDWDIGVTFVQNCWHGGGGRPPDPCLT